MDLCIVAVHTQTPNVRIWEWEEKQGKPIEEFKHVLHDSYLIKYTVYDDDDPAQFYLI